MRLVYTVSIVNIIEEINFFFSNKSIQLFIYRKDLFIM